MKRETIFSKIDYEFKIFFFFFEVGGGVFV
jgi:hypothetical protein